MHAGMEMGQGMFTKVKQVRATCHRDFAPVANVDLLALSLLSLPHVPQFPTQNSRRRHVPQCSESIFRRLWRHGVGAVLEQDCGCATAKVWRHCRARQKVDVLCSLIGRQKFEV